MNQLSRKIKVIIFDYDGVIVDSFPTVHRTYKEICDEMGIVCPASFEEFKEIYGYSAKEAMSNLGVIKPEDNDRFDEMFREKIIKQSPKLFKGIEYTIDKLSKEYRLLLITSNIYEEAVQKLKRFNLFDYFELVEGDRYGHRHFKKSEMIKEVMKNYNLRPDEVVYIGDRDIDYDIAQKAGLPHLLLVDYGWGYDRKRIKQKTIIRKPADIIKAVRALELP